MDILAWVAVAALSVSFWLQAWKIHKHKEVRDLSLTSYVLFSLAYAVLAYKAWDDEVWIFLVKQLGTLVPSIVIVYQIITHKDDEWE
jgi:uncharacterized protein with PQ loop repeat